MQLSGTEILAKRSASKAVRGVEDKPQTTCEARSKDRQSTTKSQLEDVANGLGEHDSDELDGVLREEFLSVFRKIGAKVGTWKNRGRPRCKGVGFNMRLIQEVDDIIISELSKGPPTLWRLNCLVYAGAETVEKRVKCGREKDKGPELSVQQKSAQILHLRKTIFTMLTSAAVCILK